MGCYEDMRFDYGFETREGRMRNQSQQKEIRSAILYLFILWVIGLVSITWLYGIGAAILFFVGSVFAWAIGLFITYDLYLDDGLEGIEK